MPLHPAGAGMYILNLVRALTAADADHDYVVYVRRHSLGLFAGLPPSFSVVDIGQKSRIGRQVWEQVVLPRDLRRRRAVLLHSPHHTTPLLLCPCPRLLTVHDVTFFILPERYPSLRRTYFQIMTILAARAAAAIVVPSNSVREEARRFLNGRGKPLVVVPEGVDPAFRPLERAECARTARERYGLPDGYLLSLGTREPGKNRAAIFRALAKLVAEGRDLHLAVVGQTGWAVEKEDAELAGLGIEGRVHFTGYVPQEDLPAIYNAASVFVFPSLYEGFGLPALEAMACGIPVITSNLSSLPEVTGGAARLMDPHDASAIAVSISEVLDDPTLARLMSRAGLERAAGFSWEACARDTVAVYRRILGEE